MNDISHVSQNSTQTFIGPKCQVHRFGPLAGTTMHLFSTKNRKEQTRFWHFYFYCNIARRRFQVTMAYNKRILSKVSHEKRQRNTLKFTDTVYKLSCTTLKHADNTNLSNPASVQHNYFSS